MGSFRSPPSPSCPRFPPFHLPFSPFPFTSARHPLIQLGDLGSAVNTRSAGLGGYCDCQMLYGVFENHVFGDTKSTVTEPIFPSPRTAGILRMYRPICWNEAYITIGGHKPPGYNPLGQNPLSVANFNLYTDASRRTTLLNVTQSTWPDLELTRPNSV